MVQPATPATRRRLGLALSIFASIALAATLAAPVDAQEPDDEPPCTSLLTPMVSTFRTGSSIGIPLAVATLPTAVGTPASLIPDNPATSQLEEAFFTEIYPIVADTGAQLADQNDAGLVMVNEALAPLSEYNAQIDGGIATFGDLTAAFADSFGTPIQPFDRTTREVGVIAQYFRSDTC